MREFGSHRVFAEQLVIRLRTGTAVAILIGDSNQALVEERVALPGDLHPGAVQLRATVSYRTIGLIAQYLNLTAAGGCIDADNLLVATQFDHRNHERHEMNVESALGLFARRTKQQEIEYGQDVGIETIVTLACE